MLHGLVALVSGKGKQSSIIERHEGSILSGAAFLGFMLVAGVIANTIIIEVEKARSKDEDARALIWKPKVEKIDKIEIFGKDTRKWLEVVNKRNVAQLATINQLKERLVKLETKLECKQ